MRNRLPRVPVQEVRPQHADTLSPKQLGRLRALLLDAAVAPPAAGEGADGAAVHFAMAALCAAAEAMACFPAEEDAAALASA